MSRVLVILGALLLTSTAVTAHAETDAGHQVLAAQVAAIENAFAATMAARDLDKFAEFLAEDTVFMSGKTALRGKAAVIEVWQRYYEGPDAPFSWRSAGVQVLDSGDLALSQGPVYNPDGTQVGNFNSIWRRQGDGSWKIVFDHGSDHCPPPAQD